MQSVVVTVAALVVWCTLNEPSAVTPKSPKGDFPEVLV